MTDNGIDRAFVAIDVDPDANIITLTPMSDGSGFVDSELIIKVVHAAGFETEFTISVHHDPLCLVINTSILEN